MVSQGEFLDQLARAGDGLKAAAVRSGLDATVPTCPEWSVRDLLRHVGGVHRWARVAVAERRAQRPDREEARRIRGSWPADDDGLLAWYEDGLEALLRTLESAEPDLACWTFLPAPSGLAFWCRRQAHETAIHWVDAELAAGSAPLDQVEWAADFAVDGIDEVLAIVRTRFVELRAEPSWSLGIRCTDVDAGWRVRIGADPPYVDEVPDVADCIVSGPASAVYLMLWNRLRPEDLEIRGDASVLQKWRETVAI